MPKLSSSVLNLPGEEAFQSWNYGDEAGWQLASSQVKPTGGIWAIGCRDVDSAPFWLPESVEDNLDSAVALHWAAHGLEAGSEGKLWSHWVVAKQSGRLLVGTVALATEGPGGSYGKAVPDHFELSSRLYPLPVDGAALWKELGRYVVAFSRNDHLLHASVLCSRELDESAVSEIQELATALELREFLPVMKEFRVWTGAFAEFHDALKKRLKLAVIAEAKPSPQLGEDPLLIIPPDVAIVRETRKRQRLMLRWLSAAAIVYVAVFSLWAGWLWLRQYQLDVKREIVKNDAPLVEAVRETQVRWDSLQAAVNPDTYPVEVFHQIVSLLPEQGIRLKEFSVDMDKLVVGGEASSVNHALKFKAELEGNQALQRYEWNFPQPTVLSDNRANFRAEGSLKL